MISEEIKRRLEAESFQENFPRYFSFFKPFFNTEQEAVQFISTCEHCNVVSKRTMHQLFRGISMGDNAFKLDETTKLDGIQVQYWIMTIETLYKTTNQQEITSKSKIIRDFFSKYISSEDNEKLTTRIQTMNGQALNISSIADLFNGIRNMVAHEGIYWMCLFQEEEYTGYVLKPNFKEAFKNSTYFIGDDPQLIEDYMESYYMYLTGEEIRNIIVRGGVNFLKRLLMEVERT